MPSPIVVNNPTDVPVAGETDLRQAIVQANTTGGDQTIVFDSTVFAAPQTITLGGTRLELSDTSGTETITAPAVGVTVSGGGLSQVFLVDKLVTASISGVAITNGNSSVYGGIAGWGSGLHNSGSLALTDCTVNDNSSPIGGGVYNSGTLALTNCTVTRNTEIRSDGGCGGLFNSGTLALTNCTVSGNSATTDYDGSGGVYSRGMATLTNCTISGNSANSYGGAGGVYIRGTATLTNCTVSANSAGSSSGSGGVINRGTATLINSIVAGNSNSAGVNDFVGNNPVSSNNNVIGGESAGGLVNGFNGNIVGVFSPLLAPLGNYGGSTQTMPLLPGSPAIDAGAAGANVLTTDQRGFSRVGAVDIGAFESQGFVLTPAAVSSPQTVAIGSAFAKALAVTVTANNSIEPVNGGVVRFASTPAANGASALFSTSSAVIAAGQAAATVAPDNADGSYVVVASVSGSSATFSLTNVGPLYSGLLVNTTSDSLAPGAGLLSLREAIGFADDDRSGNTMITFSPAVFGSAKTITLTLGTLELSNTGETEAITGPAVGLTVRGDGLAGLFQVDNGVTASISGLTMTGGKSSYYGGGLNNAGTLTLADCTVSGNSASAGGGVNNSGSLTLTNSTVGGNAAKNGGAVNNSGSLVLTNSTVSTNSASNDGGGVNNSGLVTLTNATVGGNTAVDGGGVNNSGALVLADCTISGNTASRGGGGLYSSAGSATLGNTIIAGNTSQFSGDIGIVGHGLLISQGNNLIGETDGSSGWLSSDLTGTVAHPLNAEVSPLGNYGGPTQTIPELFGSPAIGAGNINLVPVGVTTDQRGQPRLFAGKVDIGAYQLQVVLAPSFVVNTTTDYSDPTDGKTSLREAIASANAVPGHAITFDVAVFATPQTITLTGIQLELSNAGETATITGPAAGVTVSAGGLSRVLEVDANVTASISGLKITSGNSTGDGGGVSNLGSLSLTKCTISGNSATEFGFGGGVSNYGTLAMSNCNVTGNSAYGGCGVSNGYGATATLTNCTVSGNGSTGVGGPGGGVASGGGVNNDGTLTMTDCTVSGNSAVFGGGLYNIGIFVGYPAGTAVLTNCTVSGNVAEFGGGGLFNWAFANATMTNCTVSGNSTVQPGPFGGGGGVYNGFISTVTLTGCTISGNKDNGYGGGGVRNTYGCTATLTNCTVSGNSTLGNGGGVLSESSGAFYPTTASLTGCTISGNVASNGGGIANQYGSTLTLKNSTVSFNQANGGAGGNAFGGGLDVAQGATATVTGSTFLGNSAHGGAGGAGANGGNGYGGAVAVTDTSTLSLSDSTLLLNIAQGGAGGSGANGGNGAGGAVFLSTGATATINQSFLSANLAVGGNGVTGGNGFGGGAYVANGANLAVTDSTIVLNAAFGGSGTGKHHSTDGTGNGGGVYTLGTFTDDAATIIQFNVASTSGNNIAT